MYESLFINRQTRIVKHDDLYFKCILRHTINYNHRNHYRNNNHRHH